MYMLLPFVKPFTYLTRRGSHCAANEKRNENERKTTYTFLCAKCKLIAAFNDIRLKVIKYKMVKIYKSPIISFSMATNIQHSLQLYGQTSNTQCPVHCFINNNNNMLSPITLCKAHI